MKTAKFTPKKTSKGWQIIVPPSLSQTGKMQRRFFPSKDSALKFAGEIKEHQRNHGTAASVLPPGKAEIAERAFALLGDLPPERLIDAVRAFVAAQDVRTRSIPFRLACEQYRAARSHRTAKHLDDFRRLPARFPGMADLLVCDITPQIVEEGLTGMSPPWRNLNLRELRALFNFAIKRDWLTENPAGKVELGHVAPPKVPILTAPQLRALFDAMAEDAPALVPMLAIEAFAGLRPTEATKISWQDFDFVDGVLTVPAHVAKTRRARHIALHPTCWAWIEASGRKTHTGPLCALSPMTLRRTLRAIRAKAGIIPWPQDGLRHTFASAALAAGWRDIGGLCLDLGHTSQQMLHRHYHRAIRAKEAKAWFDVLPPAPEENVIPFQGTA